MPLAHSWEWKCQVSVLAAALPVAARQAPSCGQYKFDRRAEFDTLARELYRGAGIGGRALQHRSGFLIENRIARAPDDRAFQQGPGAIQDESNLHLPFLASHTSAAGVNFMSVEPGSNLRGVAPAGARRGLDISAICHAAWGKRRCGRQGRSPLSPGCIRCSHDLACD